MTTIRGFIDLVLLNSTIDGFRKPVYLKKKTKWHRAMYQKCIFLARFLVTCEQQQYKMCCKDFSQKLTNIFLSSVVWSMVIFSKIRSYWKNIIVCNFGLPCYISIESSYCSVASKKFWVNIEIVNVILFENITHIIITSTFDILYSLNFYENDSIIIY